MIEPDVEWLIGWRGAQLLHFTRETRELMLVRDAWCWPERRVDGFIAGHNAMLLRELAEPRAVVN